MISPFIVSAARRNVKRGGAVAQALWIDGARNSLHFCRVTQNPRKRYGGVCHIVFFRTFVVY